MRISALENYCSTTHIVGCNFLSANTHDKHVLLGGPLGQLLLCVLPEESKRSFCMIRYISRCTACCCTNSGENVPVVGARDSTSTSDLDTNSAGIEMIVESLNPCVGFEEEKNEEDLKVGM